MSQTYYSKYYYEHYKSLSNKPVKYQLYIRIIKDFMMFLASELLEFGKVLIPEKLGIIYILGITSKVKVENGVIKGLAPDWKATKDSWAIDKEAKLAKTIIYHFNEESGGVRYSVKWDRKRVLLSNKFLYDFKLARKHKRALSKLIQNKKEYYIKK